MEDFKIVEMEDLSGGKAKIYSVILDGEETTLLEQFFEENKSRKRDMRKILDKIRTMANFTGCKIGFFKEGEGKLGDGMVALKGTGLLRLYGIRFHDAVVLFGSGGIKLPKYRTWEDSPELSPKGFQMEEIAAKINKRINNREIQVLPDGTLQFE